MKTRIAEFYTTMMPTSEYLDAEASATEALMDQIKSWRTKLTGSQDHEGDRLFAAQLAAHLLEASLRPSAIRDLGLVSSLIETESAFKTSLTTNEICRMIAETGAIHKGHFKLLSGEHSEFFFMFSKLGMRVEFRKKLAEEMAARLLNRFKIKTVVAPVTAGGLLLQDIASSLHARFAFLDVDDHSRPVSLREGHSITGDTAIINDMTTTGQGIKQMIDIVNNTKGATVKALALIATRGKQGKEILASLPKDISTDVLFHLRVETRPTSKCPDCLRGYPVFKSEDINR